MGKVSVGIISGPRTSARPCCGWDLPSSSTFLSVAQNIATMSATVDVDAGGVSISLDLQGILAVSDISIELEDRPEGSAVLVIQTPTHEQEIVIPIAVDPDPAWCKWYRQENSLALRFTALRPTEAASAAQTSTPNAWSAVESTI